jgi:hypothetical protein
MPVSAGSKSTKMKSFITIAIFFFTLSLAAQIQLPQGCKVEMDSSWVARDKNRDKVQFGKNDSIFYRYDYYLCEDGREGTNKTPLGDTSIVLGMYKSEIINRSRQWVAAVVIAGLKNQAVINPARAINRSAQKTLNQNILDLVAKEFQDSSIVGTYTLQDGTNASVDAAITIQPNGSLRLRWGTTNRVVQVYSDVHIRILNHPTAGRNIDLVRRANDFPTWFSDASIFTIKNKKLAARQDAQPAISPK